MWGRKKEPEPDGNVVLSLDDQIERVRVVATSTGRPASVGALIELLSARATMAAMEDRDEAAREDRRVAAGLLRGFDGQGPPVRLPIARLVWMGALLSERKAGDLDAALDAARRTLVTLDETDPEDITMYAAFLQDLEDLRRDLRAAGRPADVATAAVLASDLAARLAAHDEERFGAVLGFALVNEAAARANAGEAAPAAAVNEEAIRLLQQRAPGSKALTTALDNRTAWERRNGQWEEAVATQQLALAEVRATSPTTRGEVERLNKLFLTLVKAGLRDEAQKTIGEAVHVTRRLVRDDPSQISMLATLLGNQANLLGELRRYEDALASSEEALALREQLAASQPSPESDKGLAMVLNNHAAVLRRVDRLSEAAESAARSVAIRRRLAADGIPNSVALLANALNTHAEQLGRLGDGERAVLQAEEAAELLASLPPPGAVTRILRANQETLGRALAVAGRHDDAVVAAQRAVELGRTAAAEAPGERRELVGCLESLADRLTELGRDLEAGAARAEAEQLRAGESS